MITDKLFLQFHIFFRVIILHFKVLWVDDTLIVGEDYFFSNPLYFVSVAHLVTSYFKAETERDNILAQHLSCFDLLAKA
jgi:hypothetical protein